VSIYFKHNHYVPIWYQKRFIPESNPEHKYYYLDLDPETKVSGSRRYLRKNVLRWGPKKCFSQDDLYTTNFGNWKSREIEEKFFGKVEGLGLFAIDYFAKFKHPSADGEKLNSFVPYLSIQKLRTPKGIGYLQKLIRKKDKNEALIAMQSLQTLFCAIWGECIWCIADASNSETKFIISDHPITIYNKACFPNSEWCIGYNDPDIRYVGSHTIFPLNLNKVLILTNLAWVRNPHQDPLNVRPNPNFFRESIFNFSEIQTQRMLSDIEVNQINYIIKKRALKYIAGGQKEWLFPEYKIPLENWNKFGDSYLLMPDPRSLHFGGEITIGYSNKRYDWFDEYGRKPWQAGYDDKTQHDEEWHSGLPQVSRTN